MRNLSKTILVTLLMFGVTAFAAEPKNIEELKAHFATFEARDSFTADYSMTMDMAASGQPQAAGMGEMAMSGKLTTKGEQMRMSMEMNMGEALGGMEMNMDQVMGEDMVMHMLIDMQGMVQAMKMDMNVMAEMAEELGVPASAFSSGNMGIGMMGNPSKILETYEEMYDLEIEGKETLNDEEVYVVSAALKADVLENFEANPLLAGQIAMFKDGQKIYLGVNDGVMRKMDTGSMMSMTLRNVDFDAKIDSSVFTLEIPEGTMEMDLTEMMSGAFAGQN